MEATRSSSSTISLHFHHHPPKPRPPPPPPSTPPAFHRRQRPPPRPRPRPDIAFPESLPLHTKNPRAIYRDIQRFARDNKLKQAFAILDYLDHQAIPVNSTTFSALIAAVIRTKSLSAAKQVHAFIRSNDLDGNEFLRTKLVHMYASCGSLDSARLLLDGIPSRTAHPWNALIRGSVVAGGRRFRDATSAYLQMRELGVELNVYTFSNVLKSFAGASAVSGGMKVHALLFKNGLIGSNILLTCLVDMYFKSGKIKLALKVFDEIPESEIDVVLFGAMISGFVHNKLHKRALEFLRVMGRVGTRPNSAILTAVLPAIGDLSALKLGREAHAYAIKTRSYESQPFVQSALIDMYCKCGDLAKGRRVFYRAHRRDPISWTAMISGYVSNRRLDQALRSVIWMQREGIRPDVVTIATVLPVCSELRALKQGREIHSYAVKNRFLPNVSVTSSLMVMYSRCGAVECSRRLFEGAEKRNVILWTVMIGSFAENGLCIEALEVARSMALSRHRPDSVAIARMLTVSAQLKSLRLGKELHGYVLKKKFESVHFIAAEVVKMYGKCGSISYAGRVFRSVKAKGSMTWTAIVEAHRLNGQYQEAIRLFDHMRDEDFDPNHFTFESVLSACEEGGFADDATRIFGLMTRQYKIKATEELYSLMIRILTRFGRDEEAQKFVQLCSSL